MAPQADRRSVPGRGIHPLLGTRSNAIRFSQTEKFWLFSRQQRIRRPKEMLTAAVTADDKLLNAVCDAVATSGPWRTARSPAAFGCVRLTAKPSWMRSG